MREERCAASVVVALLRPSVPLSRSVFIVHVASGVVPLRARAFISHFQCSLCKLRQGWSLIAPKRLFVRFSVHCAGCFRNGRLVAPFDESSWRSCAFDWMHFIALLLKAGEPFCIARFDAAHECVFDKGSLMLCCP